MNDLKITLFYIEDSEDSIVFISDCSIEKRDPPL